MSKAIDPSQSFSGVENYSAIRPSYGDIVSNFVRIYRIAEDTRIADIGAGPGNFGKEFARSGFSVDFVDPDSDMVRHCQREVAEYVATPEKYTVRQGTSACTGLADKSVDLIIAGDAAHWFRPKEDVRREFNRILTPGGKVFMVWRQLNPHADFTKAVHNYFLKRSPDYSAARGHFVPDLSRLPETVASHFIDLDEEHHATHHSYPREMSVDNVVAFLKSWAATAPYLTDATHEKGFREFLQDQIKTGSALTVPWDECTVYGAPRGRELYRVHKAEDTGKLVPFPGRMSKL